MLNSTQSKNIIYVYQTFIENEPKNWTDIDDYFQILDWLDDDQVYKESAMLYSHHKNKNMGCAHYHKDGRGCIIKNVMEAVDAIIELYEETKNLHIKNRYILCYYLVLCQCGDIVELVDSKR